VIQNIYIKWHLFFSVLINFDNAGHQCQSTY